MLILTRRIGETFVIHHYRNPQNQVKVGFDAPRDVRVDREEIFRDKQINPKPARPRV